MRGLRMCLVISVMIALSSVAMAAPAPVLKVKGSGTKTTQKFEVKKDWDLSWSYDCSNFGYKGLFVAEVFKGNGELSYENMQVNQLGKNDTGVEHFHTGGTFYLVITSMCSWQVSAWQL
jgi:hypothetical protein